MRGFQKVTIAGNVGRDPETRTDGSGKLWCNFSVAVNDGYGVKWFRVSTTGNLASICEQYVRTGMEVVVDGSLGADKETGNPRVYMKQNGQPAASFDLLAREVVFVGGRKEDESNAVPTNQTDFPF